ncbi:MAG: ferritin family protein [Pseudomonadota bacterium]
MAEPINPTFPVGELRDARQLMELAVGMEAAAARRYRRLAAAMERAGDTELATLFHELAVLESEHQEGLGRWAAREGLVGIEPAEVPWRLPETFAEEDGELLTLTPYKALAVAVRNEESAFAFFTYLAAIAPNDHVRSLAESMAREELSHVAQLRAMRRKAFHSGPRDDAARRIDRAAESPQALEAAAGGLESGSEEACDLAARELTSAGDEAGATILREAARRARLLGGGLAGAESTTLAAARDAGLLARGTLTRDGVLKLCLRDAEEVLEFYLGVAERTADPEVLGRAQELAECAVARLAMVRSLVPRPED